MNKLILFGLFIISWYYLLFVNFVDKNEVVHNSPVLRARLGTILWHSADDNGVAGGTKKGQDHVYCFYPQNSTQYRGKAGEYILKRASSLKDCNGWLGKVVLYEGVWVSEREKIWWNGQQRIEEELATVKTNVNQI
ncbi:hypothetical protein HY386_00325 [Candidatus Daviesbacteria bacterium]|nr:hypothetical protein [Candidatus Daviesbacteria bacterium]